MKVCRSLDWPFPVVGPKIYGSNFIKQLRKLVRFEITKMLTVIILLSFIIILGTLTFVPIVKQNTTYRIV